MNNFEIEIKNTIQFTDEDLSDILCAAFEGGVGYWCCLDNTTDSWKAKKAELGSNACLEDVMLAILKDGGKIRLFDCEDEDEVWFLTMDKLKTGIKMAIDNQDWCMNYDHQYEIEDIDSYVADCIIQYALFAEIVYG